MSGGGEKTEKPTPKRLAEARKRGQVAKSSDFTAALVLGGVALILAVYGTYFVGALTRLTREMLLHQLRHPETLNPDTFSTLFGNMIYHIIIIMLPFLAGTLLVGVLGNVFQVKLLFSMEPLKPNLGKLNPLSGFKRLFSQRSVVELIKGILKMAVVAACAFGVIHSQQGHLMAMSQMGFGQAWVMISQIAINICVAIAIALFVIGIADWWYQHYQLMKQLRMSRQEIKDEMKNSEGSPEIKRKIRSTGQAMMRQRMMKSVPLADVVVTNPTHFAVAIQYDPDEAPAPRVVAKGADHVAFKIREIAKENGIPIVENKLLARSLYALVEVEHMIPPELFIAVAEVLAFVFKKNKGRRKKASRRPHGSEVTS